MSKFRFALPLMIAVLVDATSEVSADELEGEDVARVDPPDLENWLEIDIEADTIEEAKGEFAKRMSRVLGATPTIRRETFGRAPVDYGDGVDGSSLPEGFDPKRTGLQPPDLGDDLNPPAL